MLLCDVVRPQVLASLEDRDLNLEKRRWAGKREQLSREYREAMAGHDRAQVNILKAQLDQASAQLELAEEQLARAQLVAPFAGNHLRQHKRWIISAGVVQNRHSVLTRPEQLVHTIILCVP